jgi:hypothetical protein
MDDPNRTSSEIKKAEFRENVKQVLLQLLVQKQLRS